jgi:hypothetical protein
MYIALREWAYLLVTVVDDRLVTVNDSNDIEVRFVHTGQIVHTIRSSHEHSNEIHCITPVPGHSKLP